MPLERVLVPGLLVDMGVRSADVDSRGSLALVGGTNLTSLWQCCPQRGSLGLIPGEQNQLAMTGRRRMVSSSIKAAAPPSQDRLVISAAATGGSAARYPAHWTVVLHWSCFRI